MTTIKLKNGSGAPLAGDLVQGEPALDLTNKRLYTENSSGTVIEVGTNPGASGAVTLNHSGNAKLATTATGIDVTGQVKATSDFIAADSGGTARGYLFGTSSGFFARFNSGGTFQVQESGSTKLTVNSTGIDVTGTITTTGNVGIGNSIPSSFDAAGDNLVVGTGSGNNGLTVYSGTANAGSLFFADGTGSAAAKADGYIQYTHSNQALAFATGGGTERMRIDSSGQVGIGESSPFDKLVVRSSDANSVQSALSLKNGDIGTSAGVALNFVVDDNNNVITSAIYGQRTASAYHQGSLQFLTRDSGGAGLTERMRIDASGNVGVGTQSPDAPLTLNGSSSSRLNMRAGDTRYGTLFADSGVFAVSSITSTPLVFGTNDTERMRIDSSGNLLVGTTSVINTGVVSVEFTGASKNGISLKTTTASNGSKFLSFADSAGTEIGYIEENTSTSVNYSTSSDQRLKDNIVDAPSASDDIDAIQVRSFDWKVNGSHQKYGMVAQELQTVAPEAVSGDADSDDMMGVDYSKLVPMLVKEIQSLRARVAQLEGAN